MVKLPTPSEAHDAPGGQDRIWSCGHHVPLGQRTYSKEAIDDEKSWVLLLILTCAVARERRNMQVRVEGEGPSERQAMPSTDTYRDASAAVRSWP